jgi:sugar-specific transcriptional regulator TrmB
LEGLSKLSKERIIKVLKGFGFSNIDTQVYVFLAIKGPHNVREITVALNLHENKVYGSLKDLESIEIVKASIEYPLEFIALPFEELLDLFIEVKKEQAKTMEETKDELLFQWKAIIKKNS